MTLNNSALAIGRRLRYLRKTANLNLTELCKLLKVSFASVSYWENGLIDSPIKSKSMQKVIAGFNKVGIEVTEIWLRTGQPPYPMYQGKTIRLAEDETESIAFFTKPDINTQLIKLFAEETSLFTALPNAVIIKIDHAGLAPYINPGDHLGGLWQPASLVKTPIIAIFELDNHNQAACLEIEGKQNTFTAIYPNSRVKNPLKGLQLEKIAPVIRLWR